VSAAYLFQRIQSSRAQGLDLQNSHAVKGLPQLLFFNETYQHQKHTETNSCKTKTKTSGVFNTITKRHSFNYLIHTGITVAIEKNALDWIVQCFTSPPTQYRLYGRRFYRSKDPTNSINVLKEKATKENTNNSENRIHTKI